jgi:hypothetical protein
MADKSPKKTTTKTAAGNHRSRGVPGVLPLTAERPQDAGTCGRTFWLRWNTLCGSHSALIAASRA